MLSAEQVVTRAEVGRDGGVELGHLSLERRVRADLVAVLVDLEPDVTAGGPRVDVLAVGDAGHVEEHRSGVTHAVARSEAEAGTGSDGLHSGDGAARLLVAAHQVGADILDGLRAGVVVGLADVLPIGGPDTIDDGLGEEV